MAGANPILMYYVRAVPTVVQQAFKSGVMSNPVMEQLYKSRQLKALTGPNVRIPYVNARHSNAQAIDASTNWTLKIEGKPILNSSNFDWGQYAIPLTFPHETQWRATKDEYAAMMRDLSAAVTDMFLRDLLQHILLGKVNGGNIKYNQFPKIGTLNGAITGLASAGLENGALVFDTPANQAASGATYLGRARSVDTTDVINNWYNQFEAHSGMGPSFFQAVETIVLRSAFFRTPGGAGDQKNKGISIGMVPLSMLPKISKALRTMPGTGASQVTVSVSELEGGKGFPTSYYANGIKYSGDFFWDLFGAACNLPASDEPCMLIDPTALGFYVQAQNDMKLGALTDMSPFGSYHYFASAMAAIQFVIHNLPAMGCTKRA